MRVVIDNGPCCTLTSICSDTEAEARLRTSPLKTETFLELCTQVHMFENCSSLSGQICEPQDSQGAAFFHLSGITVLLFGNLSESLALQFGALLAAVIFVTLP